LTFAAERDQGSNERTTEGFQVPAVEMWLGLAAIGLLKTGVHFSHLFYSLIEKVEAQAQKMKNRNN
jgi:hypothetical protein